MDPQIGATLSRTVGDRGHYAPTDHKLEVFISGQKRDLASTS